MQENVIALSRLFDGWEGYQTSIVHALQPLAREQITWRPAPGLRSVGEVPGHVAFARVHWFARMPAPHRRKLERSIRSAPWRRRQSREPRRHGGREGNPNVVFDDNIPYNDDTHLIS